MATRIIMKDLSESEKFKMYEAQERNKTMFDVSKIRNSIFEAIACQIISARCDGGARAITEMCKLIIAANPSKDGIIHAEDLAVKILAEITKYSSEYLYEIIERETEGWYESQEGIMQMYSFALHTLEHEWEQEET